MSDLATNVLYSGDNLDILRRYLVRLQGIELFFGGDPFGRDLAYLVTLAAEGKLDPQLAGEFTWEEMPDAVERLRSREVAGKICPHAPRLRRGPRAGLAEALEEVEDAKRQNHGGGWQS